MPMIETNLQAALIDSSSIAHQIETRLIETGGEITPEVESLISLKDFTAKDLAASVDVMLLASERLEKSIEYFQAQIDTLAKIKASLQKAQTKITDELSIAMEKNNLDFIAGLQREVRFRQNPPKVEILDELAIPNEFMRVKVMEEPDKQAISRALKDGVQLDWARLVQTKSLKISAVKNAEGEV